jgi:hypothetical protein
MGRVFEFDEVADADLIVDESGLSRVAEERH